MPLLEVASLPCCQALLIDAWNSPPRRYFAAYRVRGPYRWLLGHPVVDEFATISSPIFLTPRRHLGKIYNAGLSLGHRRDPEMGIDLGWPPLCVGLDLPAPPLEADWESRLLSAIEAPSPVPGGIPPEIRFQTRAVDRYQLQFLTAKDATVLVTSAPLLPEQLSRLCETAPTELAVAVSIGNRLERAIEAAPQKVSSLSEESLLKLLNAARDMLS
jgi:hypothetical protein